jgi:hypothetical protein
VCPRQISINNDTQTALSSLHPPTQSRYQRFFSRQPTLAVRTSEFRWSFARVAALIFKSKDVITAPTPRFLLTTLNEKVIETFNNWLCGPSPTVYGKQKTIKSYRSGKLFVCSSPWAWMEVRYCQTFVFPFSLMFSVSHVLNRHCICATWCELKAHRESFCSLTSTRGFESFSSSLGKRKVCVHGAWRHNCSKSFFHLNCVKHSGLTCPWNDFFLHFESFSITHARL